MTWTVAQSGTYTPASTAEAQVGTTDTGNGTYIVQVDLGGMANGDSISVDIYTKTLSGGTSRRVFGGQYKHAQAKPIKQSAPLASDVELIIKITSSSTTISIPWKLLKA